jgi:MFS family permease
MQMGFLSAIGGVTALLAGPLAGIAADRYRRKPLMIAADVGRAAALAMIPIAAAQSSLSLPLLFAVVTVTGLLTVFFHVAYQTMVPFLVPGERLLEANSKLALTASTAEVIGPAMTGMLVQALTAPRAILLDAASFLVSAISILTIRGREAAPQTQSGTSAFRDLLAGLPFAAAYPILRPLALRAVTASLFGGFFSTLYVLFAIHDLRISPAVLGVVIALGGVSNF